MKKRSEVNKKRLDRLLGLNKIEINSTASVSGQSYSCLYMDEAAKVPRSVYKYFNKFKLNKHGN